MKRIDLEHIIRAAGDVTGMREMVIIGSQAILGQFPDAPDAVLESREADVYFPGRPELAQKVEGAIGELSHFDHTHGYYAGSADDRTPTLPQGWRERLIPIENANTNGITGWCLEVHDITVSKYAAGREKDRRYIASLWSHGLIDPDTVEERLDATPLDHERRELIRVKARRDALLHGPPQAREAASPPQNAFADFKPAKPRRAPERRRAATREPNTESGHDR